MLSVNEKEMRVKLVAYEKRGLYSLEKWELCDEEIVEIEKAKVGDRVCIETALSPVLFSNEEGNTIFVYAYTTESKIPKEYRREYAIQLSSMDYFRKLIKAIKNATNKKVILLVDSDEEDKIEITDELLLSGGLESRIEGNDYSREYNEFITAVKTCEQIIVSLGGRLIAECKENETWVLNKEDYITEKVVKNVYKFRDSYVRVDKMYFSEKPFLLLQFADEIEGPYEDADPFPFDLPLEEIELEIKFSLGVLPYPSLVEKAIAEKRISDYAVLLAWNGRYVIYNEWEDAFLLDMEINEIYQMGDYYGDPDLALIDKQGAFAVVIGSHQLCVFDFLNKELKTIEINIPDWIMSLDQEGRTIEVICENGGRYKFEI